MLASHEGMEARTAGTTSAHGHTLKGWSSMNKATPDVKSLFGQALEIPSLAARAAFLDKACNGNSALRSEVDGLLQALDQAGSFLHGPDPATAKTTPGATPVEAPGTRIGAYKLLQQLGEGGMGVVYMAEQEQPLRRRVAVKIIKPGMDSAQVIARFEVERQALAVMDHQNIARVLDAGTTDSGRPYFVMELVHGVSITQYCDTNKLSPRQRLELFLPVCLAIQHAHQKGIIHRDLKPSNVMVTLHDGKPVPKVIDFGVAKATEQRLTERTLFTQYGTIVGTLEYMAPEQAELSGLGVDTRSDIYALGVLLYELLTGTTPLERNRLREAAYDEMLRLIREVDPSRPSQRISTSGDRLATISAERNTEPAQLWRLVHGELDWIVMRCLEKDRTRRYETANALGRDVERYLKDEPVEACPPTTGYKLRKFARKHQKLLLTAAAFAVLLLLGVTGSAWQAVRATQAEGVANENAVQAQEKEHEAKQQRDEVQALNEKLQLTQAQLRSTLYAAHMNLAKSAWDESAVLRVLELLDQHRPKPGEPDLRGFEWYYLDRLCRANQPVLTLEGAGFGQELAFSPDGKRLIALTRAGFRGRLGGPQTRQDPVMKVWDPQTGKELHTFTLKDGGRTVVLSPDANRLASASDVDNTLKVWDIHTGKELLSIKGAGSGRYAAGGVVFSPDGKRMLGHAQGQMKIWDAQTGREIVAFKGKGGNGPLVFSPDGKRLAGSISQWDKQGKCVSSELLVWDAQTGQQLHTLEGHADYVWKVLFSPDGKRLYSASGLSWPNGPPGEVRAWDAQTGQELFSIKEQNANISHVALSPGGKHLVTSVVNAIKVWDAETGKANLTLQGHTSWVREMGFSPEGKHLASTSNDQTIRIWDFQTGQEIRSLKGLNTNTSSTSVFSPDGKRLVTPGLAPGGPGGPGIPGGRGGIGGDVLVWNVSDAPKDQQTVTLKGVIAAGPLYVGETRVVFSPDLRRLAGLSAKTVKVWDARTGQETLTMEGHANYLTCVAFSSDGKRVASGDGIRSSPSRPNAKPIPGVVKLWDAQTGKELHSLKGHDRCVVKVAFSPDGTRLASAAEDQTVKLWDTQTGKELLSITPKQAAILPFGFLTFSPDGKRLVTGGKIWDAQTGEELLKFPGPIGPPGFSVAFSPDGKRLTNGRMVWDAQTGQELLTIRGAGSSGAFSPDGKRLATVGDRQVKIWDAQTGQETLSLKTETGFVNVLAFSADSDRLGIVTADGTVTIWDATPMTEKR